MATDFRKILPDLKKSWLPCLLVLSLAFTGCKRIVQQDKSSIPYIEKQAVTDAEFKKMMALKSPLKTINVDKYQLSIPENTDFDTMRVMTKDLSAGYDKIGKIDLSRLGDGYLQVILSNIFTRGTQLYTQTVSIIPEKDPQLLTIKDIKANLPEGFTYYSDENSLILENDDSFTGIHFDYDTAHQSYFIYQAQMSWSQKLDQKDKLDLFLHLIKNAKNLLQRNPAPAAFNSWEEYVQNRPVIETNILKNIFKKATKELKVFLDPNSEATLGQGNSNGLVKLYRPSGPTQLDFYRFIDAVKTNQLGSLSLSSDKQLFNFSTSNAYSVKQEGSSYIIEASAKDYSGQLRRSYHVVCPVSYKNKDFFLTNEVDLSGDDINLFVKMFNYFGKKYTLATN